MVDCLWPLIHATSTNGLIIKDNKYPETPPARQLASSGGKSPLAIELEKCEDVTSDILARD
jgi:hypothetical protein